MRPVLVIVALTYWVFPVDAGQVDFDRDVAPILSRRCIGCHSGSAPKGELDLSRKDDALRGGKLGPAIQPGTIEVSQLWIAVSNDVMPPGKPISPVERAVLKTWIEEGAVWGQDPIAPYELTTDFRAGKDWWSLQPLPTIAIPDPTSDWDSNNPIDRFVQARLQGEGLTPSPNASPKELIRRVYFDLIGLPPPPDVVFAFERSPTEQAFAQVVEQLLASPQYGERWARHWLDLVRYAESDGFERNMARPNAWRYRDWVVDSFNSSMPYDKFALMQIAGDAIDPENPEAQRAAGFLVAGVHNTVVAQNEFAQKTARQDELEDIVAAVGQTFLGMTIQCCRCHDHKFDPLTQMDFYRVAASLSGVDFGEKAFITPKAKKFREEREASIRLQRSKLTERFVAIETEVRRRVLERNRTSGHSLPLLHVSPKARWMFEKDATDEVRQIAGELRGNATVKSERLVLPGPNSFVRSEPLPFELGEKTFEAWLTLATLDQSSGGVITIESNDGVTFDSLVFAERQPKKWMAGSNHFLRTRDLQSNEESARPSELVHLAITYQADGMITVYRNGVIQGESYRNDGENGVLPTYAAGSARVLFGLRHSSSSGYFFGEIEEARLYDRALTSEEIEESWKIGPDAPDVAKEALNNEWTRDESTARDAILADLLRLDVEQKSLPAPEPIYTVVSREPTPAYLLERGNVEKRKAPVTPGGVSALEREEFGLDAQSPDSARRIALAHWLVRQDNPLLSRVIVNRIWHHHFGRGLVDTPSDFGFNGGRPSHPELLDWLANWVQNHDFDLKALHRLMVTSRTYQQSSAPREESLAKDFDNRLLWRFTPHRLDAESVRDAILMFAGELNLAQGGPGYRDTREYFNSGTTYYDAVDPQGWEFQRRTLYRFSPRGERGALLDSLDCPDPSSATPRRQSTLTPLQALALLNDQLVLDMADRMAKSLQTENRSTEECVRMAFERTLYREPNSTELKRGMTLVAKHGLAALARALFNSNEFVFVR